MRQQTSNRVCVTYISYTGRFRRGYMTLSNCFKITVPNRFAYKNEFGSKAFTLIEMLVVIAIIGVLASMLMPALGKALDNGRLAVCINNQKQVGMATFVYADTWYGSLPPLYSYDVWKPPYISQLLAASGMGPSSDWTYYRWNDKVAEETALGKCPAIGGTSTTAATHHPLGDYGFNLMHVIWGKEYTLRLSRFPHPSTTLFSIDARDIANKSSSWCASDPDYPGGVNDVFDPRHNGGSSTLFLDGHAEWMEDGVIISNPDDMWNSINPVRAGYGPG